MKVLLTLTVLFYVVPGTRVISMIELRDTVHLLLQGHPSLGESGLLTSDSLEHLDLARGSVLPKAASENVSEVPGLRDASVHAWSLVFFHTPVVTQLSLIAWACFPL